MSLTSNYRPGAKGALLDEYQRALKDLQNVISGINGEELTTIVDPNTADANCRSIQTILSHVVRSGYGYAIDIHNRNGDNKQRPERIYHTDVNEYIQDLDGMFSFTERVFENVSPDELEQPDESLKMKTPWNQRYDIEQLTEHAIVHILRHRRQIEKFRMILSAGKEK